MPGARVLGVIPARLAAERLPGKPLRQLLGRPLIQWVARNAQRSGALDALVIASDAEEVLEAGKAIGVRGVRTGTWHQSGTSRVAEVAAGDEFRDFDIVVNVQGDELFLPAEAIRGAVSEVERGWDVGTAAVPLAAEQAGSPSVVKVVVDELGRALYFSRCVIPYARGDGVVRYWQHLGVYAARPETLEVWLALPPTELEEAEKLEQLRPLGHGLSIGVARLTEPALPGIDTEEDLRRAEAYLATRGDPFSG